MKNNFLMNLKMGKIVVLVVVVVLFAISCGTRNNNNAEQKTELSASLDGVVINGIRWATRNVDAPGTFAESPESVGMLFQWNRIKAWNAVDEEVKSWDITNATGNIWEKENDPCPQGWRVPTMRELIRLELADNEWITLNDVNGRLFGTAPNQIFLPAVGWRPADDGKLYGVNTRALYWGNENYDYDVFCADSAWFLVFDYGGTDIRGHIWRANALPVRCVSIN